MITVRPSSQRGHADHGWLDTYHTFSFAGYRDPSWVRFGALRVLNEDRVKPGHGFPMHEHDNMEIVTYVVAGALEHKDTLGSGSVIRPGDVQRMTAGRGVAHSEFNPSKTDAVHLLQIWIFPEAHGLDPGYEQKTFTEDAKRDRLCLIASRDGAEGSVTVRQDTRVYASVLGAGRSVELPLRAGRRAWVQLIRGTITVNGVELAAGDGAGCVQEDLLTFRAGTPAEFLVFDLP